MAEPAPVDLAVLAAGYVHRPDTEHGRRRAADLWHRWGGEPGDVGVDVGGGRGGLAAVWGQAGGRAVVVDPSPEMLAACPPGVLAARGRGERLPLADGSARVALFHMSLHHMRWREALAEAARVLQPGGGVGVWTMGPDDIDGTYMTRWFPSVPHIERRRFPDPGDVAAALAGEGFVEVTIGREAEDVHRTAGEWRAAVRAGFVSTLQLVPVAELAAGLAAHEAAHPDPAEPLRYPRRFTCLVATKGR